MRGSERYRVFWCVCLCMHVFVCVMLPTILIPTEDGSQCNLSASCWFTPSSLLYQMAMLYWHQIAADMFIS